MLDFLAVKCGRRGERERERESGVKWNSLTCDGERELNKNELNRSHSCCLVLERSKSQNQPFIPTSCKLLLCPPATSEFASDSDEQPSVSLEK